MKKDFSNLKQNQALKTIEKFSIALFCKKRRGYLVYTSKYLLPKALRTPSFTIKAIGIVINVNMPR
jgi:hypothetical protein